ncbi:MAG TPA: DUF2059 domain-containing protein [Bacteroidota bacterium]|jgi:hypothetical protein|nr:DUF2059 domain-containing protein [Bacteroidota bacterium]
MNSLKALLFILLLSASVSAMAQEVDTSGALAERTARELLNISGSGKLGVKIFQQLLNSLKQNLPNVPAKFWDEIAVEVDPAEFVNLAVPIYVRHFSVDEMKGIMAFYKTPVGTKLIQALPDVTQEMMLAGQQWGKEIGQKVVKKLKDSGYEKQE